MWAEALGPAGLFSLSRKHLRTQCILFCAAQVGTLASWCREAASSCSHPGGGRCSCSNGLILHKHSEQRKALPFLWVSCGEGFAPPMDLRHWGLWHVCVHVNNTCLLRTSPAPYNQILGERRGETVVKRHKAKAVHVVEFWSSMYSNVTVVDSVLHFKLVEKVDFECFLCVQQNIKYIEWCILN